MIRKIKKIKHTVKSILENNKTCRDDDMLLIKEFWSRQLMKPIEEYSGKEILDFMVSKTFANTESIRRSRQLIQAEYKHLQGNRKEKLELGEQVKASIHTLKNDTCPNCKSDIIIPYDINQKKCLMCFHKF